MRGTSEREKERKREREKEKKTSEERRVVHPYESSKKYATFVNTSVIVSKISFIQNFTDFSEFHSFNRMKSENIR